MSKQLAAFYETTRLIRAAEIAKFKQKREKLGQEYKLVKYTKGYVIRIKSWRQVGQLKKLFTPWSKDK